MDKHTLMTNLTAVVGRLEEAQSTIFKLECEVSDLRVYIYKERMHLLDLVQKIELELTLASQEPQEAENIVPTIEFKHLVMNALNEGDIEDIINDGVTVDYERDGNHSMTFNAELDSSMYSDIIGTVSDSLQDYLTYNGYILTRKESTGDN